MPKHIKYIENLLEIIFIYIDHNIQQPKLTLKHTNSLQKTKIKTLQNTKTNIFTQTHVFIFSKRGSIKRGSVKKGAKFPWSNASFCFCFLRYLNFVLSLTTKTHLSRNQFNILELQRNLIGLAVKIQNGDFSSRKKWRHVAYLIKKNAPGSNQLNFGGETIYH